MKDRIAGSPGRYSAVVTGIEYQKLQAGQPFAITLTRDDKPAVEGTPYSKAAVLPDDVAKNLCPDLDDPSPADAFNALYQTKAPAINRGNFFGDLDVIGDGGVKPNSVVWVSKDAKSPFPDSWGWVETWAALSNSVVQRATKIDGKMWVRTYYYKNADVGAVWTEWKRVAGYGLGESTFSQDVLEDANTARLNGWYKINKDTINGIGASGVLIVDGYSSLYVTQTAISASGHVRKRTCIDDVWGEWEWENPPMAAGVEYRTTERYNGREVYTMLVDCGSWVDGKVKNVNLGQMVTAIDSFGEVYGDILAPITGDVTGTGICSYKITPSNISSTNKGLGITLVNGGSAYYDLQTYITIKYIKYHPRGE